MVVDRVIQQAVAQVLSVGYERYFSEFSYGFRVKRDCHMAIAKALEYMNNGYEWVVDLDIEKYSILPTRSDRFALIRVTVKLVGLFFFRTLWNTKKLLTEDSPC